MLLIKSLFLSSGLFICVNKVLDRKSAEFHKWLSGYSVLNALKIWVRLEL
ncbi:hypothetical protein M758_9G187500 [Ceratodon purpureus]|uniref:Uncharacterized protein n=1 Tax=Ceratodon purpureus TaxID=3225 RepID=A0A8T0H1M6_CERPU|nr:hypothetical protein KC19_9G189800 [Ceratodon purpureus]KAG0607032.1 hypothetical protein M758_9G187500 [Ceratodon purpureus]